MNQILSCGIGKLVSIENVSDPVFASKALGDGVAIDITDNIVTAPINGTIKMLFETKHAFGIETEDGVEILVHIGIDTVALGGKGFKSLVKQGDVVKAGQPLIKANLKKIKALGKETITLLIVTKPNGKEFTFEAEQDVTTSTVVGNYR